MQDFVYFRAPVESAKAWLTFLLDKPHGKIHKGFNMSYWLWKAHVEQIPHKFFSFHGMFSLCAVKTYVENVPWKPGLTVHGIAVCISEIWQIKGYASTELKLWWWCFKC